MASSSSQQAPAASSFNSFNSNDKKTLYLFLSLSSGAKMDSSHSRLEVILKAKKIPFTGVDVGTDDKAKSLWGRRRKPTQNLPALVRDGQVLGDYKEIDEWNEYGELLQNLGIEKQPASLPQAATTTTVEKKPEDKQAVPAGASAVAAAAAAAAKEKNEQKK